MPTFFYSVTRDTHGRLTRLYDFLWPAGVGLWNLRWQVNGFLSVHPGAIADDLQARFVRGSGLHGANLRRACIDTAWSDQLEELARFLLINICALYEGWAERVVLRAHGRASKQLVKALQFPTDGVDGVGPALAALTTPSSAIMDASFYPSMMTGRFISLSKLDNLLACYRYFKETRNAITHRGGLADKRATEASRAFDAITSPQQLDIAEVPVHDQLVDGHPFHLHMRGVVGLSHVVLRIMATVDAELVRAGGAEREFRERWLAHHGRRYTLKTRDPHARNDQIARLVRKLGFPRPSAVGELDRWLQQAGLAQ